MGVGNAGDPPPGNNPDLSELVEAVRELNRRVARLESIAGQTASAPRLQVVPKPARPTLESRLGSQYLNRAGIFALLLGVSLAVHWAFSNNWIGPGAIIATGLIGGLAVIALGQWFLRHAYAAFGLSLQALGLGALYVVLWAGFQVYGVIPSVAALAGMVIITAATATAAVVQDSELLAVFGFLGGFATPFLMATGKNREVELFVYLLVLSGGVAATVAFRRWSTVLLVSFFACVAVSTGWFISYYAAPEWSSALLFATLLYGIYIAATLVIDADARSTPVIVVTATAAYLAAAYVTAPEDIGLIEVLVAAGLAIISWKTPEGTPAVARLREDRPASAADNGRRRALFFTVAFACLVFAVPSEFDPHWSTSVIWLAFGLVLMLAGFRAKLAFVRWDALVLIGVTVLKVFVVDLARLAPGYRIIAMAVLGIALLAMSFVYQRNWLRARR